MRSVSAISRFCARASGEEIDTMYTRKFTTSANWYMRHVQSALKDVLSSKQSTVKIVCSSELKEIGSQFCVNVISVLSV